ncbi:MAG: hypothetical protein HYZ46_02995 [Nitrosomonadales bacterium]|nr:hypothetical protein [Nitrosomonadales bacterium]
MEALYDVRPVAREQSKPAFQKAGRTPPSAQRRLLQCLIAQPALARQMPPEWRDQGAEAEAVAALLDLLRQNGFDMSGAAVSQSFQGTSYAATLAAAEADMLSWGEQFDVLAEFDGLMNKLVEEQRRQQFRALQTKGLSELSNAEREQYLQLLQRGKTTVQG